MINQHGQNRNPEEVQAIANSFNSSNNASFRELILIGPGHAHVLLLRKFGDNPLGNVHVTLISDVEHAAYSGMLPGHISGIYTRDEMMIDLRRLCHFAGARFIHSEARGIDLKRKQILVDFNPPTLTADAVSINVGGTSCMAGVAGAEAWAIPSKPVPELLSGWARVEAAAHSKQSLRIVVVGGGAGGVELALAMHSRLGDNGAFTVIHAGPHLLPGYHPRTRRIAAEVLGIRKVSVITDRRVVEVMPDSVRLDTGKTIAADFVFWAAQAAPPAWLAESGLETTIEGFVRVTPTLQTISHHWIFAAGDVAAIENRRLPKSGVFAVRMAKPLERNLRAYFAGAPLGAYKTQRHSLSLIGTADGRAIASYGPLAGHSALFWRLKDWIDRRFMKQFTGLTR
ncbi:pyridine nucleotide-disulfide oxidoreductase family protein [Nitrosospira sp. Nsp2]|uniref:FAD-dependent oxidoreductase n=1 Tax=Nitrosospira sp. Nsp2 TaxID=136548 RepID=UPI000D320A75|nr:FAD-dependent oxidoreductase [Nitrosospira sp. Nsp2]PTR16898.1 pyridine nucleotide-disulfide oxidoreductase family protein [Nitrosospira sp. Nsp2]